MQFRRVLRLIIISQLTGLVGNSSYDEDDSAQLVDFLNNKTATEITAVVGGEQDDFNFASLAKPVQVAELSSDQSLVLRYIAGWLVHCERKRLCSICDSFYRINSQWNMSTITHDLFTFYKEFGSLTKASDETFNITKHMEKFICKLVLTGPAILLQNNVLEQVEELVLQEMALFTDVPHCCSFIPRMVKKYTKLRVHTELKKLTAIAKAEHSREGFGSRSQFRATEQ